MFKKIKKLLVVSLALMCSIKSFAAYIYYDNNSLDFVYNGKIVENIYVESCTVNGKYISQNDSFSFNNTPAQIAELNSENTYLLYYLNKFYYKYGQICKAVFTVNLNTIYGPTKCTLREDILLSTQTVTLPNNLYCR